MKKLLPLLLVLVAFFYVQPRAAYAQSPTPCSSGCIQWEGEGFVSGTNTPGTPITGVTAGSSLHIWFCGQGPTAYTSVTVDGVPATLGPTQVSVLSGILICLVANAPSVSAGSHTIVVNGTGPVCTNCTVIVSEWGGSNTNMISQNGGTATGGISTPVTGGSVTATGSGIIETFYSALSYNGDPTQPATYSVAYLSIAGFSTAWTTVTAGSFDPSWTTSSGGDTNTVVMSAIFQPSGGVTLHTRAMRGQGS